MRSLPAKPIVRYHGGKWRIANWIIDQMPPHRIYVEPFAGAASVLMRKPRSNVEVINDLHSRLINVFRVLRDPNQARNLERLLRLTPYSIEEYHMAREQADDPIEDARRMIVLGYQGHGSTAAASRRLTGWRRGVRPRGPHSADEWARLPDQVAWWCERLQGVYIECSDAIDVILRWDSTNTLFYIDPPYLAETRSEGARGYAHEMSDEDHCALAEVLHSVKGMVILSGYPSQLYDELYSDWRRLKRKVVADRQREAVEVLWLSPNVDRDLFSASSTCDNPGCIAGMAAFDPSA